MAVGLGSLVCINQSPKQLHPVLLIKPGAGTQNTSG